MSRMFSMSGWPGTRALTVSCSTPKEIEYSPLWAKEYPVSKLLLHMSFHSVADLFVAIAAAAVSVHPGGDLLAKGKSRTPVTSIVKGLEMSPQELRVRVRALVRPTLGIIEEKADLIIANTSDPVVRRGAITLKIEMTTTILAAMFRGMTPCWPSSMHGGTCCKSRTRSHNLGSRPSMGNLSAKPLKRSRSSRTSSVTSSPACRAVVSPSRSDPPYESGRTNTL